MRHQLITCLVFILVSILVTGCPSVILQSSDMLTATAMPATPTSAATVTLQIATTPLLSMTTENSSATPPVSLPCLSTNNSGNRASDIYNSGVQYMKGNKPMEAIACFQEFIGAYPQHNKVEDAHYNLGVLFERIKDFQAAKAHFLEIKPFSDLYAKAQEHLNNLAN